MWQQRSSRFWNMDFSNKSCWNSQLNDYIVRFKLNFMRLLGLDKENHWPWLPQFLHFHTLQSLPWIKLPFKHKTNLPTVLLLFLWGLPLDLEILGPRSRKTLVFSLYVSYLQVYKDFFWSWTDPSPAFWVKVLTKTITMEVGIVLLCWQRTPSLFINHGHDYLFTSEIC